MPSSYSSCLRTNRRRYAQKHGLEYCEYDAAPTRLPVNFCWHKLIAVQKLLRNSEPRREAIFWMDADALFMDMQKSAVDILSEHPLKDFIFAADYNACDRSSPGKRHALTGPSLTGRCEDTWSRRISGGIFMVRNTPAARARLDYIWTKGADNRRFWADYGSADNVEFERWRVFHSSDFRREAVSIDQTIMNSMRKTYRAGDFVFHHSGGGYEAHAYLSRNASNGNPSKYASLTKTCTTHMLGGSEAEDALEQQTARYRKQIRWPPLPERTTAPKPRRLQAKAPRHAADEGSKVATTSQCSAPTPAFASHMQSETVLIETAATASGTSDIPLAAVSLARQSRPWRYFSAFRCEADICITFKDDSKGYPHRWVGGARSRHGLRFTEVYLVLPGDIPWSKMSHNLAILPHNGDYIALGGTHNHLRSFRAPYNEPWNDGIYLTRGSSWCFERECQPLRLDIDGFPVWNRSNVQWAPPRKAMDGRHPGCVEARSTHKGRLCEYDGRLSLVHFKGRFLVYSRANAGFRNPRGMNGRFVQVAHTTDIMGRQWSPFELIRLPGWHVHNESTDLMNIYFFGVQINPVDPESLLAVYPLAHQGRGCISISVSRDGFLWSRPAPLIHTGLDLYHTRTTMQPAVPGLVKASGGHVFLYAHANVPGMTNAKGKPELVRYRVPVDGLKAWSARVLNDPQQFTDVEEGAGNTNDPTHTVQQEGRRLEDWSEAAEYSAFTPLSMLPTAENRAALSERRKVQPDGPFFLVSVGTVPGVRAKGMVLRSLESLLNMARAPDCTLLVAPRSFMRFPNETVNLEQIRGRLSEKAQKNPTLRMRYCARDYGPGSKLLCALPVLRRLAKPAMERWMIVLADDDRIYKPWALHGVEAALMQAGTPIRHAFSYKVYKLWWLKNFVASRSHMSHVPLTANVQKSGGRPPDLRLGQGTDMMAIPAHALLSRTTDTSNGGAAVTPADRSRWSAFLTETLGLPDQPVAALDGDDSLEGEAATSGAFAFFRCAQRVEPLLLFHDDLWISTLVGQANITMLHVPVNWTGVTNNMLHSCWIKNNRHPKASAYSSLLHINGTLNRSAVVGDGGAESGGSDKLRLTHTRIRAATHAAFGRMREQCHS